MKLKLALVVVLLVAALVVSGCCCCVWPSPRNYKVPFFMHRQPGCSLAIKATPEPVATTALK